MAEFAHLESKLLMVDAIYQEEVVVWEEVAEQAVDEEGHSVADLR